MSWEEEKQAYIRKLEKIVNGIDRIRNLEGNRLISEEMERDLEKLSAEAGRLLPKLIKGEFSIAVVGLEKAGKSSFANALTDLAVLPTDGPRCTYTSTCIRPGEENRAVVNFYSQAEFARNFTEKPVKLEIPDAAKYNINNLSLKKYEELYAGCSEIIKKAYEETLNHDIRDILENQEELKKYIGHAPMTFHGGELEGEEFASFIKNPARAMAVKDVTIYSTGLKDMPNVVIHDLPAFDSPTPMHRELTLQKLGDADAIIMVAAANKPSLTAPALSIFKNHDNYGCTLDKKMFIFANKADAVSSPEILNRNIEITYSEWIDKRKVLSPIHRSRIVFGSALAHLGGKVAGGEQARQAMAAHGLTHGIPEMRAQLSSYYENERQDLLKSRASAIIHDALELFSVLNPEAGAGSGDLLPELCMSLQEPEERA